MIDFPIPSSVGQVFDPGTGIVYSWDGVAWNVVAVPQTRTARQNNLIVNPAMSVSQENGTTVGSINNYYPADQWQLLFAGPVCSGQQVNTYSADMSIWRIRKTVATPKASLAAGDYSVLQQPIEGSRLTALGYGYASAMQAVLRFGFKAPAGTYSFRLANDINTRVYIKNFTISAGQANTDTVQVFAIPGETSGVWKFDNTAAAYLAICDAVGTTYQGVEGWQAGNFMGTAANTNMVATNGNVVELFDVGLYPDPDKTGLPPPFIAPAYSDALIDCMRYWERGATGIYGYTVSNSTLMSPVAFKVVKRIVPTVVITNPGTTQVNAAAAAIYATDTTTSIYGVNAVAAGVVGAYPANFTFNARM